MFAGRRLAFKVMLSGANVGMPHELLDIVELVTGLFKPVGEGSAQGMGGGTFGHAFGTDGGVDGLLDTAGVEVMPLDDKGTGVYREVTGGEDVLPFPGSSCSRVFARQSWRHGDRNVKVNLIKAAAPPGGRGGVGETAPRPGERSCDRGWTWCRER